MSSAADSTTFSQIGDPSPPHSQPSITNNGNSDEVDSLPSTETDDSVDDEHPGESDAEREWRESLQQLELLLTMVLVPYLGKYFGRKAAYWGWAKYMEWKYPVEVVITSPGTFKAAGAAEAAAAL